MKKETLIAMIDAVLEVNSDSIGMNDPKEDPDTFKMAAILECWKEDVESGEYVGPTPMMIWALRHGKRRFKQYPDGMETVVDYFLETAKPQRARKSP